MQFFCNFILTSYRIKNNTIKMKNLFIRHQSSCSFFEKMCFNFFYGNKLFLKMLLHFIKIILYNTYLFLLWNRFVFIKFENFWLCDLFFGKKQENQQFHEKNIHKDILFVACKFLKIKLGEILSMNQCLPNAKTINQTPF